MIPDHIVEKAAREWAMSNPSSMGGFDGMSSHRQALLLDRMAVVLGAVADDLRAEGAREALTELAAWLRVPGVSGPLVTEQDVIAFAHHHYPEETR